MYTSGTVWNDWELGKVRLPWALDKDSTGLDCLEPTQQEYTAFEKQIRARQGWTALRLYIYRTYRHERMVKDKEDDDVRTMKDDQWKFIIGCLISSNSNIKFDADRAPKRSDFIWFFWERLKPWLRKSWQPLRWWTNVDGTPEAILERVPCIQYSIALLTHSTRLVGFVLITRTVPTAIRRKIPRRWLWPLESMYSKQYSGSAWSG